MNNGKVNCGVLPEAMSTVEVVELTAEAGAGTRVIEAHVSATVIVIVELSKVFPPEKVVCTLKVIVIIELAVDDFI